MAFIRSFIKLYRTAVLCQALCSVVGTPWREGGRGRRRRNRGRRKREEGGEGWRKVEKRKVLPLLSTLSSGGGRLLAPKIKAQLRSQMDLNLSTNSRDFQVSRKYPLGCWQGWVRSCQGPWVLGGRGPWVCPSPTRKGRRKAFLPSQLISTAGLPFSN